MKSESGSSGSSSGGTSETKPPAPHTPPEKLSEQEFLAQQAESAKLAMGKAWQEMKTRLGQGVAPQVWAKEYPWITVGAAAVAGFVAAATLIPSKEEQALKKLAAIERALNPPPRREDHLNGDGKKEGGGFLGSMLREAIRVAQPVLMSMLTGGMASGMQGMPPQQPGMEDAQQYYGTEPGQQ
ncbi:MAG TPA: hypothetical protein VGI81_21460 [Tepidisphaeraceae bacterium]|jgi:hypothetical protein